MTDPQCLEKREFACDVLLRAHPPVLRHPHKQLAFQMCCDAGYRPRGILTHSKWAPTGLPESLPTKSETVSTHPGFYDYVVGGGTAWHVNFADPQLFVAYGSGLLAQDEIQVLEHPILGSLRESLLSMGIRTRTEEETGPTPVLIQNAERVCEIDTAPSDTSPRGLYGNRFQVASPEAVRAALRVFPTPTLSNLIAIAAPVGSGIYTRQQITSILYTAFTGFRAAVLSSPQHPVEIHTGFWGCGAFGGNRPLMVALQLLAARLADVDRLVFHLGSPSERFPFDEGRDLISKVTRPGQLVAGLIESIVALQFRWGQSDGN